MTSAGNRLSRAWDAVLDVVLTTEWQQRRRLTMCGLANLLILCCILTMQILSRAGLADPRLVGPWTVLSIVGMGMIFALIRSGLALPMLAIIVMSACSDSRRGRCWGRCAMRSPSSP